MNSVINADFNILYFRSRCKKGDIQYICSDYVYNNIKNDSQLIRCGLYTLYLSGVGYDGSMEIMINKYCRNGIRYEVIIQSIRLNYDPLFIDYLTHQIKNINEYFIWACKLNQYHIVRYFILVRKPTNLNKGFRTACIHGHILLMALLINHGANDLTFFTLSQKIHPFLGYTWQITNKDTLTIREITDYTFIQQAFCSAYINNFNIPYYDMNITNIIHSYISL